MKTLAHKPQQAQYQEEMSIGGCNYTLKISRKLRPGSNGLLKLVVQNANGEVMTNHALLRAIAEVLDNRHQCQTVISADEQKRPVIVIPNRALTK